MQSVLELDATGLVERLGDPHRYFPAYQRLLTLGDEAAAAAREGLRHDNASVRRHCCKVLDHVLDEPGIVALTAALDDPSPSVRIEASHALSCDRCKGDSCRPTATAVLGRAVAMLRDDPDPHVRAMAVELVGAFVHTHAAALAAIEAARSDDVAAAVRKKAGWYLPGGAVHDRTRPHVARAGA